MEITRKVSLEGNYTDLREGDQIEINVNGVPCMFTCYRVVDEKKLMVCDEVVEDNIRMNRKDTNEGGFDASDLKKWLNTVFKEMLDEDVKNHICGDIRILSYGEVFGNEDRPLWIKDDGSEQLPLMKKRKNRVAYWVDEDGEECYAHWWLRGAVSAAHFALVHSNGYADYNSASYAAIGVRPAFEIC